MKRYLRIYIAACLVVALGLYVLGFSLSGVAFRTPQTDYPVLVAAMVQYAMAVALAIRAVQAWDALDKLRRYEERQARIEAALREVEEAREEFYRQQEGRRP